MAHSRPFLRELPVKLGALPMRTLADLNKTSEQVLKKVALGQLIGAQSQTVVELPSGSKIGGAFAVHYQAAHGG